MSDIPNDGLAGKLDLSSFDPFRRKDSFGEVGTGRLAMLQRVLLCLRIIVLVPPRLAACATAVVAMRVVALICASVPSSRPWLLAPAASVIARAALFAIGFHRIDHVDASRCWPAPSQSKISVHARRQERSEAAIVVSNHTSWIDILLIQTLYAAAFVTRAETRRTPIIGGICDALPCIYVDRAAPKGGADGAAVNHARESTAQKIADRAAEKMRNPSAPLRPLCIFPEGTTTNGRYLLPFRTGAFVAGVAVQPVLVTYGAPRPGTPALAWETISAWRHIVLVLATLWHRARIVELPLYEPSEAELGDAALFAHNVHHYMAQWAGKLKIQLASTASGYEDKQEYHRLLRMKHGLAAR